MWTVFSDCHSGGYPKEKVEHIIIEAAEDLAIEIFVRKYKHHPQAIACSCCGQNYWTVEYEELIDAVQVAGSKPVCVIAEKDF